jgi:pentatricopeptide repeat protein
MKGLTNKGALEELIDLSTEMQTMQLWGHVTTNTLLQAAVKVHIVSVTEQILEDHMLNYSKSHSGCHTNAEAYTTVMDGYIKAGDLQRAIDLLKLMKNCQVEPNEYAYTCLIGGLARNKKINHAKKMMAFMKSTWL